MTYPDLQRLIDLPGYGKAKRQLLMTKWRVHEEAASTRNEPFELTVRYEGGFSCFDNGDNTVTLRCT